MVCSGEHFQKIKQILRLHAGLSETPQLLFQTPTKCEKTNNIYSIAVYKDINLWNTNNIGDRGEQDILEAQNR